MLCQSTLCDRKIKSVWGINYNRKNLIPSKTVAYLLFADSHSCGYLQHESMQVYADRKRYSCVIRDGVGSITAADELDVTSLRERCQKVNSWCGW